MLPGLESLKEHKKHSAIAANCSQRDYVARARETTLNRLTVFAPPSEDPTHELNVRAHV